MPPESTAEEAAREALAMHPFPPTPWVKVADEGIIIAAGYSEALNRLLRWMPKAKWRPEKRGWLVPFSSAEAVRAVLPEISRLADAAHDLDAQDPDAHEAAAREVKGRSEPAEAELLQARLIEAAELLHGPAWRAALAREPGDPSVARWIAQESAPAGAAASGEALVAAEIAARLRRKAKVLERAADALDQAARPDRRGA